MDAKPTKALDASTINLKRKQATQYDAPLTEDSTAASVPANTQRTPGSPWMPISMLLVTIKNMVSINNKIQIVHHHAQFVVCKVA
jgi:hypothetical protein